MIKLPITFKNKSCTSDQGCDNVYNGDTLYVEGYNDLFRVTVYDNNTMQLIKNEQFFVKGIEQVSLAHWTILLILTILSIFITWYRESK